MSHPKDEVMKAWIKTHLASSSFQTCLESHNAQHDSLLTNSPENSSSFDAGEPSYTNGQNLSPEYDSDDQVQCPPHTTERKLLTKIDLHVVPFLCILYLLAFLDR